MNQSPAAAEDFTPVRVTRRPHVAERIVMVDGIAGCGKTMLAPIIGALDRVELPQYSYALEYACTLWLLGKLTSDAATAFIRLLTDLQLYHVMIARETNFRWNDLSGVMMNSRPWRYFSRLLMRDGAAAIDRIKSEKPVLNLVTHNLLVTPQPIVEALGDRVQFIEVVRHPLYMIKQWYAQVDRLAADPRVFSICYEWKGQLLSWHAFGWEEKYLQSSGMDRVIYLIQHLTEMIERSFAALPAHQRRLAQFVPFERFVSDPMPYMRRIEELLGVSMTATTRRMMKKQNVPRSMIAAGINLKVYRDYGWEPPARNADEQQEFARRREFVAKRASREAMAVLDKLCVSYEQTYLDVAPGA